MLPYSLVFMRLDGDYQPMDPKLTPENQSRAHRFGRVWSDEQVFATTPDRGSGYYAEDLEPWDGALGCWRQGRGPHVRL